MNMKRWVCAAFILLSGQSPAESGFSFSWQNPHAEVLAQGDLKWAPEPFRFETGKQVRYIDFAGGDDLNDGLSKKLPWKHHPWDVQAAGKAKEDRSADTYLFKRGVTYRGVLLSNQSGTPENPVRLTSDPAWGKGPAVIAGSKELAGGWKRLDEADAPKGMPDPDKVWVQEVRVDDLEALWEVRGEKIIRIPVARDPNWTISDPDNVMKEWYEWTGDKKVGGEMKVTPWSKGKEVLTDFQRYAQDTNHVVSDNPDFYKGARIWSTYDGNMSTPHAYVVGERDIGLSLYHIATYSAEHKGFAGIKNPQSGFAVRGRFYEGAKYFMEDLPVFLDAAGEYYYDQPAGKLYLRLPEDRDPNASRMELAQAAHILTILNSRHITVSGLEFRFNSPARVWGGWPGVLAKAAGIRIVGNAQNITVKNCRFQHLMTAVAGYPRLSPTEHAFYCKADVFPPPEEGKADVWDQIAILDNDISDIDDSSVYFTDPYGASKGQRAGLGKLGAFSVLRNRFYFVGHRQYQSEFGHVPAIGVIAATVCEIAGNMIDRSGGPGIWVFSGKGNPTPEEAPLIRTLIHHNKVSNSCLINNDWGGIESWWGGPTYIFDNISYNPIGPRHAIMHNAKTDPKQSMYPDWACNAYAYYLDHGYKNYLFNNIGLGKSNDNTKDIRNRAAGIMVHGFMNHWFNNSFENFLHGITGSAGEHNYLLGNLFSRIRGNAFEQNAAGDFSLAGGGAAREGHDNAVSTLAYKDNLFDRTGAVGGPKRTLETSPGVWNRDPAYIANFLRTNFHPLTLDYGVVSAEPALKKESEFDFRPADGFAGKDRGVRFFVPWPLYATVGEWNFRLFPSDPTRIPGENYYMTDEHIDGKKFDEIPRNPLHAPNATAEHFITGGLEDWHPGVLVFDGSEQHLTMTHDEMYADYPVSSIFSDTLNDRNCHEILTGKDLIYPGSKRRTVNMDTNNFILEVVFRTEKGGTLVSKTDGTNGYTLAVNAAGAPELTLRFGGKSAAVTGAKINDGKWHHLLAETDRAANRLKIFTDGKCVADKPLGQAAAASLSNHSDFLAGKGPGGFFTGELDFLRVARGSLADSKTTIEELYAWQFHGPFLKDFAGRAPVGHRDAGALEAIE